MMQGDGKNAGVMLELVKDMNSCCTVTGGKVGYRDGAAREEGVVVGVQRSLLTAESEEGFPSDRETQGSEV